MNFFRGLMWFFFTRVCGILFLYFAMNLLSRHCHIPLLNLFVLLCMCVCVFRGTLEN